MDIDELQIVRLTQDYNLKEFDCGDPDLNEFLLNDAKDYQKDDIQRQTVPLYFDLADLDI